MAPVVSPGSKWSTRYGTQYRRLCARPGCSAPAVATLRFQSTERLAWLVELDDHSARTQGDLCARHAAALVLPRGWELRDERVSSAGATDAEPSGGAGAGGATRRTRARRNVGGRTGGEPTQLPGLDPEGAAPRSAEEPEPERETESEPEPEPEPEHSGSRGVPAQFGTNEDIEEVDEQLDEILDAQTPLLRRAFRNAKPN